MWIVLISNMIDEKNIFRIMKKHGLSKYRVKKDLGIAYTTFRNWKKGKFKMSNAHSKMLEYYFATKATIGQDDNIDTKEQ